MDSDSRPSLDSSPELIAGRYEVLGLLGVGGMGAVYKVRDRELDDVVALKMLKREIAEAPGIVERFRREVKLARRVTHPNVARTFDLGEHEGERFLTMELIEGESLAKRLAREGTLGVAEVAEILASVCAGLEAAHAAGVVHRDLKPDNVLLAERRVVITDFGIARAQEAGAAARTAIPLGTPAYMAPEQVEASPNVDARADVYALGAMTFELLTGRLPFEAESVFAIAAMRLTQPPPDPRTLRADIPESLAQLVQKCMARRPEDRPQSAREIAARLAVITMPSANPLARTAESRAAHTGADDPLAKTVAVVPFRNAGSADDEYLVDGLTDDIIDGLSMTPGLRVRPRGVVMQHKNASGDPRQIGRDLGVQVVVDGTVRVVGDAIRVSARVLSVEDGFQIWAKRFDGTRADVLRIGDDAARAIAEALTVRKPTRQAVVTDPVAIDLYLRGRHEYFKFWADANARAVDLLRAARERAPKDPLIMAGYAAALARQFGTSTSAATLEPARAAAEEAVSIAPQLGEAHLALAMVHLHEHQDPVKIAAGLTRALTLSPLLADAHELRARLLAEVGPPLEAFEAAHRAMQLEPRLDHLKYTVQARSRIVMGDWKLSDYGEPPTDPDAVNLYWVMAGRCVLWTREAESIRWLSERAKTLELPRAPFLRSVAEVIETKTITPPAREVLHERTTSPHLTWRIRCFWNQMAAELYAYAGEPALEFVRGSIDLGLFDVVWMDSCPLLEQLRGDPEFRALRETVAERARRVLVQLRGSEATLAS